jgi:hypothetical protein
VIRPSEQDGTRDAGGDSSQRLGRHRWTIERTTAWLAGCRRLHRLYERKADHFLAFIQHCLHPHLLPMYHVEWTVDEDIAWGRNAKPAVGFGPRIRPGGHCVVLRGRLNLTVGGASVLDFDGAQILLDLADPLPEGVTGTWVELFVEREKVALYPYKL